MAVINANYSEKDLLEGLDFIWLEITPSCNLYCRHCYTESSPLIRDPKIVDWNKVLDRAYGLGCERVQFIGGEPLANPNLLDYIERADYLGYKSIEVYSNLTLMNDRLAKQFSKYGVSIATSFYSPREEVHEKITNVKGSFKKTVNGIKTVIDNNLGIRAGIVTMDLNKSDINDAIQYLSNLGIKKNRIKIDHTRPMGRGSELVEYKNLEETLCGNCWKGSLTISYDGSVFPCVFSREVNVGNVNEEELSKIVLSEKLRKFRNSSYDQSVKSHSSPTRRPNSWCDPTECAPCGPSSVCSPDGDYEFSHF